MMAAPQETAFPIFILPGALNACAEDAGRALARLQRLPGPVFAIDGAGLVDFREALAESLERGAPGHGRLEDGQISELLGCHAWTVLAEAAAGGCVFVEVADCDMPALQAVASMLANGCGMLVRCASEHAMLDLATRCAAAQRIYLHAGADDEPLQSMMEARLRARQAELTVSRRPVPGNWLRG